jgi:hypothetical protein
MNKRISALEDQLKIQKENLNKMSTLANKKEEKLNYDISKYQKQINDLKNELEQLNSTITNLTEEKENNTIKLTELIHENEELKKNKIQNNNSETQNKKYENIIIKLKRNISKLTEEKKSLEEVIIKQEQKVNEFSSKVDKAKKEILKKDKELQESIEYNAKLTSTINFHKKEIQKLKQNNSTTISTTSSNKNNNNNKDLISIMNLQKEIQNVKKEIENKDKKINLLSMNNKILQGKVNKLSQTTKNGFNLNEEGNPNKTNTNTDINNNIINLNNKDIRSTLINTKKSDIISDSRKCFIIAKPKKSAHIIGLGNGRQNSTSIRPKNDLLEGMGNKHLFEENNNLNNNIISKNSKYSNNALRKGQKRNNSNITNIKRNNHISCNIANSINNNNDNNIVPLNNIPNMNSNNIGNNINININNINYINGKDNQMKLLDMKYKEIENKYKKDLKDVKDDTLFGEEILDNFNLNEEIVTSQTLKPKKKRNFDNNEQSLNTSQEKDFQIIESYCLLSGQKNDTIDGNLNLNTSNVNNISETNRDKDESKIMENKKIQELHNHVQKILDEFN